MCDSTRSSRWISAPLHQMAPKTPSLQPAAVSIKKKICSPSLFFHVFAEHKGQSKRSLTPFFLFSYPSTDVVVFLVGQEPVATDSPVPLRLSTCTFFFFSFFTFAQHKDRVSLSACHTIRYYLPSVALAGFVAADTIPTVYCCVI